jgi:hypothetical protein
MRKRKHYTPSFKAKVAVAALKGEARSPSWRAACPLCLPTGMRAKTPALMPSSGRCTPSSASSPWRGIF